MQRRGFLGMLLGGAAAATGLVSVPAKVKAPAPAPTPMVSSPGTMTEGHRESLTKVVRDFGHDLTSLLQPAAFGRYEMVKEGRLGKQGMTAHVTRIVAKRDADRTTHWEMAKGIAAELIAMNVKRFGVQSVPRGVDGACVLSDASTGISVRVIDYYSVLQGQMVRQFDVLVG